MSLRGRNRPRRSLLRHAFIAFATVAVARRTDGRERERGSGTAATVVVMGLLGLLIIGMVQYAADIHGQQAAQAAASIALATAREQNGSAAAGQAAATSELAQLTTALHDPSVDVQRSATEVTVTITGTVTTVLGITQHVSVSAAGPVDRFTSNVRGFANSEGSSVGNTSGGGPG